MLLKTGSEHDGFEYILVVLGNIINKYLGLL